MRRSHDSSWHSTTLHRPAATDARVVQICGTGHGPCMSSASPAIRGGRSRSRYFFNGLLGSHRHGACQVGRASGLQSKKHSFRGVFLSRHAASRLGVVTSVAGTSKEVTVRGSKGASSARTQRQPTPPKKRDPRARSARVIKIMSRPGAVNCAHQLPPPPPPPPRPPPPPPPPRDCRSCASLTLMLRPSSMAPSSD